MCDNVFMTYTHTERNGCHPLLLLLLLTHPPTSTTHINHPPTYLPWPTWERGERAGRAPSSG